MPQRTLAASSRADHAGPAERHPMPAHCHRQPARGPAGSAADGTSLRRHDGVHRRPAELIRARAARGRDSALTEPSPGARGASGSRRDRAAWRSGAADPHNASTPEHQRIANTYALRGGARVPAPRQSRHKMLHSDAGRPSNPRSRCHSKRATPPRGSRVKLPRRRGASSLSRRGRAAELASHSITAE